jgi:hypothetical protein
MSRHFEIFEHGDRGRLAVPVGFSPVAALLGAIWPLTQRLWGSGAALLALNAVLAGMLYVNRAPAFAYGLLQAGFAVFVGANARRLRALGAERAGYAYRCTVPARDRASALAKLAQLGGEPLPEWKARVLFGIPDWAPRSVRGVLAVALLTLKAAFRYRLVLVLLGLLIAAVFALPAIIKHDGTATGFTQILLTYTLSAITALLGFATLWLACGTLARDIDDLQLLLVVVKPVPRWQIWLGKWLGIMALNLGMVALAGAVVYGLMEARARQLAPEQQFKLRNEVLVARQAVRSPVPDLEPEVERIFEERRREAALADLTPKFIRDQVRGQLQARLQAVAPGQFRPLPYTFDLGPGARERFKGRPLFVRARFFTAEYVSLEASTAHGWEIAGAGRPPIRFQNSFGPETPTEFPIPPDQIGDDGVLQIRYANLGSINVVVPLEDGIEVLYPDGGFAGNFARGLVIILCWLGLLAAVGLFTASFLQFTVAAFVSLGLLVIGLSGGTLRQVVEQGGVLDIDNETGAVRERNAVNRASVYVYGGAHWVLTQISGFSPVGALSTGRTIGWAELARAVAVILGLAGGGLALGGMGILTRREIAMPHS